MASEAELENLKNKIIIVNSFETAKIVSDNHADRNDGIIKIELSSSSVKSPELNEAECDSYQKLSAEFDLKIE